MADHPFPEALARCGGDESVFIVTASMIAEDAPIELEKLVENLGARQTASIVDTAHILRGMLSTFDDGKAVAGLQSIEDFAKQDDVDHATQVMDVCRSEIESLIADIQQAVRQSACSMGD